MCAFAKMSGTSNLFRIALSNLALRKYNKDSEPTTQTCNKMRKFKFNLEIAYKSNSKS
jgi:hypothetical protein